MTEYKSSDKKNPKDTSMCYGRNKSTEEVKCRVWFISVEHIRTEFSGVVNVCRHLPTEQGMKGTFKQS
jgi:hypothetical protein